MNSYCHLYQKQRARIILLFAFVFFIQYVYSQQNLIRNGWLDSFYVAPEVLSGEVKSYENEGAVIPGWERNTCNQMYNPTYSCNHGAFMQCVFYSQVSEREYYVSNVAAALTQPLDSGKIYRVSVCLKPFTANILPTGFCFRFTKELPVLSQYFNVQSKAPPVYFMPPHFVCNTTFLKDSAYTIQFTYKATGGECFLIAGNMLQGKPKNWKRIPAYGHLKQAFDYSLWCYYALSNFSVKAIEPERQTRATSVQVDTTANRSETTLLFQHNSSIISSQYFKQLNEVARILNSSSAIRATIIGYTSNKGTEEYNTQLSKQRAESVLRYLLQQGVSKRQLRVIAGGESEKFPTEEKNRLVKVIIEQP